MTYLSMAEHITIIIAEILLPDQGQVALLPDQEQVLDLDQPARIIIRITMVNITCYILNWLLYLYLGVTN